MDWTRNSPLSTIKLRKDLNLLGEFPLEDAALKLLQLTPLCLCLSRKDVFYYCPSGVGPWRGFMAPPFRGSLHEFHRETVVERSWRINPDCPQHGLYKASEGIYPGHGQQKLGVGKQAGAGFHEVIRFICLRQEYKYSLTRRRAVYYLGQVKAKENAYG